MDAAARRDSDTMSVASHVTTSAAVWSPPPDHDSQRDLGVLFTAVHYQSDQRTYAQIARGEPRAAEGSVDVESRVQAALRPPPRQFEELCNEMHRAKISVDNIIGVFREQQRCSHLSFPPSAVKRFVSAKLSQTTSYQVPVLNDITLAIQYDKLMNCILENEVLKINTAHIAAGGLGIHCEQTVASIREMAELTITPRYVSDQHRRRFAQTYLAAIIAQAIRYKEDDSLVRTLQVKTRVEAEYTSGTYVRLDGLSDTVQNRMESMIARDAIGFALKPILSLRWRDARLMIDAIFHANPRVRTRSRSDILAIFGDKNPAGRSLFLASPTRAIHQFILEGALSRSEVVFLFFDVDHEWQAQCFCCRGPMNYFNEKELTHRDNDCAVIAHLRKEYQIELTTRGVIVAPSFAHVTPNVAEYSDKLLADITRNRDMLVKISTGNTQRFYATDMHGNARMLDSIGTPSVNIANVSDLRDRR